MKNLFKQFTHSIFQHVTFYANKKSKIRLNCKISYIKHDLNYEFCGNNPWSYIWCISKLGHNLTKNCPNIFLREHVSTIVF